MPGTILLDDLRSSIGDELRSHAQGLLQLGQGAVQSINDAIPPPPPVPQGPDPNQILQELQQHAQQAAAAAQPAVQVLGGAQQSAGDVLQQLQQHASNLTSDVGQQLQQHVNSLTQGAQDAVQSLATPPPAPPPPATTTPSLGGPPPSDTGPATVGQGQSAFITSLQGMAQRAAAATGIDPNAMLAIAANETGWGQSSNAQQQNNLFSLQGDGSNGSRWASYKSPQESFDAFINLVQTAPRYAQAWADRGNASKFVDDLRNAGYVVDEPGYPAQGWVDQVKSIYDHLPPAAQGAVNAVQGAGQQVLGAARGALDTASTAMNQSQFGDPQLTADEAYAACGPAAAVRFAERFGRNPTLREATDLAKQVGWTSGGGMAGITSEQQLLKNMGVDTHIVAPDWDAIAKEAQTGNPVTISTQNHYFFADGYNPQTGAFHVGRSGLDLKNGSEWMTPTQMENLMGRAQGALFADNPAVPASSTSPTSLGGTGGASNAPITIGGPAPVKAPLYVKGAMQDANGNVVADQGPTPIQSAADVLGGAAGAVGEAVGGAASALGSAAQGALAQATAPVQLQPGQVSARDQVNQVASDVQQAAQGVLGAAQDVNRMTPGTSAVNAVAPVLGAAASDLGTTARGAVDATVPVLGGAASDLGTQAEAFARSPVGQRLLQAAAENAQEGPSLIPAGTMSLYRDVMQVKNDWLEQNNPLNNLPGARPEPGHEGDITPGGLIAGLTTGIAQQFTDPLMLALLGPTSGVAEAGTGALSGAVSRIVGPQLAERLSPGAVSVLGTIAQKFSQGAIVGGLQNAMFEAEKKESTPESVGQALVVGAGLGGVIDVGAAGVAQVVRRLGQVLLDNAPQITEALRSSRLPAQTTVNNALGGVPELAARARGEATPVAPTAPATEAAPLPPSTAVGRQRLPNYPADTPEGRFEAIARPLREASPDGLLHLDLNTLPQDVLPLDRNVAKSSANGLVKLAPGGMPNTDDLRALYEANPNKRDFYYDQADQGIPTVGAHNLEEWFALNAISSMQTNVTGQVSEAAKVFGMVRQIAQEGRQAGLSPPEIKASILKAVNDYTYGGPAGPNKRIAMNRGYATGIADTGGPKTPSFAGNYGSAEARLYDPAITNDIWNWRTMNIDTSQTPAVRGGKTYMDSPHESAAANNKNLYRGVEAVFNELGAEQGVDGFAFQSSVWDGIRAMAEGAPEAYAKWKAGDFQGAIRDAKAAGVFDRPIGKVGAPEPGEISRAMQQPSVKAALAQYAPYLHDPLPPELGIPSVQRAFLGDTRKASGTLRPATHEFRNAQRGLQESNAPIVRGVPGGVLDRLGVDERGVMPWLATAHRVVEETPGNYVVHLPSGNSDTARYVAATIGDALKAPEMAIHYPDYRAPDAAGLSLVADRATLDRVQAALAADGHPTVRGPTGGSLQIPLYDMESAPRVVESLKNAGVDPATLDRYNGTNERIQAADYARTLGSTGSRFEPTTVERRSLLERAKGGPSEAGAVEGTGSAAPPGGGAASPARGGLRGSRELTPPPRTLYHGTSADYPSVEPGQRAFEGENSLGPGHYLATDPGVASGYAERAQNPESIEGFQGQGANVRKVNVPADMRLFNITQTDRDLAAPEITRIADVLERQGGVRAGEAVNELRYLAGIADPSAKLGGDASPNAVFDAMASRGVEPRTISFLLRKLGYEGIEHIDSLDGAHNVLVFPEATNRLQNAISGRQGGQAQVPFGINLAGGVAGGYAGNLATPQDASPEERLRNIGLGATAGLLGTHLITRGGAGPLLERAVAGVGREGEAGFRAPETRPTLEEQLARAADRGPRPGENLLRATTEERPPPSEEPTRQTVRGVEPGTPRNIGEVVTNPHLLDAAGPGETPMTMDERLAHQDTLEQRYQANQDRLAAIDEQLRNPTQKPERPPWGAGYTNDNLVEIAQQHGQSAYDPLWWEKAGLDTGSGEVRLDVGQSGIRGTGTREPTPTELRAERNTLALDQRHIEAAGEQQANAPDDAQFARRGQRAADLPFAGGEENAPHGPYATEQASSGPGSLAEDIVTQNGRKSYGDPLSGDGLREAPGEVIGTRGGVTGRGISDAEAANVPPPSEATLKRMPNLDAMLKGAMPEVRAQIQRAAEDNPELFDAYTQGRISHDSLVNDLATKVGMTRDEWLKTPVGKGFNPQEMVALQAAAIDAQARSEKMARDIVARGGVDALSDEQVAYGLNELSKNTQLLTVARGGRSTAGRTLESLKNRLDATMARGINASNERIGAQRIADQAKRATARATQLLEKTREMDVEQKTAVATARSNGAPKNILDQIAAAYDQLDRYNAMTLHEKADDFNALKAARDAAAAKRQAAVREPPQELLSALQAELAAERKNFANRKNTWEDMAFWDSKANEIAAEKRNAFRGGLYIEQYRKSADLAAKSAEADAKRAFDLESKRQSLQSQRASSVLEAVGGQKPSRELLASYVKAITSDDPLAAGKFIKGLQQQGWWGRSQIVRIAGLLSSTVTHMANMVGNISQVPLEVATHGMVVGIDWARAAATGGERQAYMAELGPMLEAYGPGFLSSMPDALKILQTGISPDDLVNLKNMRPGLASGSEKLDAAVEMPLRLLQAEDQVFKGGAFAMQANRVATRYAVREGFRGEQIKGRTANIVKNFEEYPELYKEAHDAMLRMVFQEHRDWIPSPRGAAQGVVSQPLPFIRTPANITAQGGGLSPFGLAGTVAAVRARGALQTAGGATSAQLGRATLLAEQRLARTALGTAIVGMGVGMGAGTFSGGKSMLTGAYDPNEASTYPQGWREWSVVTQDPVSGNTYYVPMQNFGAAGAPLAMAAILTDAGKRGHSLLDKDEAARAATSIGQYVLDNTFLQGLSDTVNVLHDPSRYANKFLESLVSSYGPYSAMGRQIQRAYGVASRNPHDGFVGLVEAMESNYPGLSGNVPESLTAIGEPRTQGISGAAAFALPVRADILRDEPTLKALRDNDVRIPPAPKAVNVGNGWSVDLTPEEQDQLQRSRGEIIRQQVAAVMGSSLYKDGDISVRNQLLSKAISNASQNSDVLFTRTLSRADLQSTTAGGRAVRRTVPTPYTVAGEDAA